MPPPSWSPTWNRRAMRSVASQPGRRRIAMGKPEGQPSLFPGKIRVCGGLFIPATPRKVRKAERGLHPLRKGPGRARCRHSWRKGRVLRPCCHLVKWATTGDLNPPPSALPDFTPKILITKRKLCGLTRQQLADQLGVSARTVLNWETGRTKPSGALWTLTKGVILGAAEGFEPPRDSAAERGTAWLSSDPPARHDLAARAVGSGSSARR